MLLFLTISIPKYSTLSSQVEYFLPKIAHLTDLLQKDYPSVMRTDTHQGDEDFYRCFASGYLGNWVADDTTERHELNIHLDYNECTARKCF